MPVIKFALPGQCLRSNLFRDGALPEACWQLCLYPGGKRAENANNVSLFLKMSSTSPTREVCFYRLMGIVFEGVSVVTFYFWKGTLYGKAV